MQGFEVGDACGGMVDEIDGEEGAEEAGERDGANPSADHGRGITIECW